MLPRFHKHQTTVPIKVAAKDLRVAKPFGWLDIHLSSTRRVSTFFFPTSPATTHDARRRKYASCPQGQNAEHSDRCGTAELGGRPGNGDAAFFLPCERGLHSRMASSQGPASVLRFNYHQKNRLKSGAVLNVIKARMVPGSLTFYLRKVYC